MRPPSSALHAQGVVELLLGRARVWRSRICPSARVVHARRAGISPVARTAVIVASSSNAIATPPLRSRDG